MATSSLVGPWLDGDRSIEPGDITLELCHKLSVFILVIGNKEHVHVALLLVIFSSASLVFLFNFCQHFLFGFSDENLMAICPAAVIL